jgi:hypothetical protein
MDFRVTISKERGEWGKGEQATRGEGRGLSVLVSSNLEQKLINSTENEIKNGRLKICNIRNWEPLINVIQSLMGRVNRLYRNYERKWGRIAWLVGVWICGKRGWINNVMDAECKQMT